MSDDEENIFFGTPLPEIEDGKKIIHRETIVV